MFCIYLTSSGLTGREEHLRGELVRDFQAGRPRSLSRPWIKAARGGGGGGGARGVQNKVGLKLHILGAPRVAARQPSRIVG